jgi:cytochrome c nitrite reductase small subunit
MFLPGFFYLPADPLQHSAIPLHHHCKTKATPILPFNRQYNRPSFFLANGHILKRTFYRQRKKRAETVKRRIYIFSILSGILIGTGAFTFYYAEGFSYFSSDPKVCINCHIMNPQYDSWQKASHHAVASCVDCHLPHDFIGKYIAKAENGWNHSKAFTLQNFHEPIMINEKNSRILQHNCVACHEDMVHEMFRRDITDPSAVSCIHCHASVGHGELPTAIGGADRGLKRERKRYDQQD